jgi:hypothetical protein
MGIYINSFNIALADYCPVLFLINLCKKNDYWGISTILSAILLAF